MPSPRPPTPKCLARNLNVASRSADPCTAAATAPAGDQASAAATATSLRVRRASPKSTFANVSCAQDSGSPRTDMPSGNQGRRPEIPGLSGKCDQSSASTRPPTPPALPVPLVRRRRIARLIAEITLERGNLVALERKVLHVPERFAVLGPANILHKHLVSVAEHRL
jgi:hypothetical protein